MPTKDVQSITLGDAIGGRLVTMITKDPINKGNVVIEFLTGSPMTVNVNAAIPVEPFSLADAIAAGVIPKPDWWDAW